MCFLGQKDMKKHVAGDEQLAKRTEPPKPRSLCEFSRKQKRNQDEENIGKTEDVLFINEVVLREHKQRSSAYGTI
jgi:hypothetical protein